MPMLKQMIPPLVTKFVSHLTVSLGRDIYSILAAFSTDSNRNTVMQIQTKMALMLYIAEKYPERTC